MTEITETLRGIVSRVTYHNPTNGWSVLRVQPFDNPHQQETVTVFQTKVFAGATMEFRGAWTVHPQFGRQFKAFDAQEQKPASAAALEKYLGSGLIKGVGPKTAHKIVKHFGDETLTVFEEDIERLTEVPSIAEKKLAMITEAWREHRSIRDVMMFLQGHGISTLFAVRIYKEYGDEAITLVTQNPYRLAADFYGIGFFSADKVALSIGLAEDSQPRIIAAIQHVLAASREEGHCYLTEDQIITGVIELLSLDIGERIPDFLAQMEQDDQLKTRKLLIDAEPCICYYARSLYFDELTVAKILAARGQPLAIDQARIADWINRYCHRHGLQLSDEQVHAAKSIVTQPFAILTGGPGCGKTTTTRVIVRLLEAMGRQVLLAAPTGRASQRMLEVIGREAKTIHRLLEWKGSGFQKNEDSPLEADFLIVDECSMLDITLSAALLKAVLPQCQVLFICDADQLPSVGAGNVLKDLISSGAIPCYQLTQVFRQAQASSIIQFAHAINGGETPPIPSPFKHPAVWQDGSDCLFIDADEATQAQVRFIAKVKRHFDWQTEQLEQATADSGDPFAFRVAEAITSAYEQDLVIPRQFEHVDIEQLQQSTSDIEALKLMMKKIHPWSSLHYGLSAVDVIAKLYQEWIPKYRGEGTEIQILTPMTRGSLGSVNLNQVIQALHNPPAADKPQLQVGERIFRQGDRVIHRRNNYDLNVFNGDIGVILTIDNEALTCQVAFYPDGRVVDYKKEDIVQLDLAYAITIHKSQGSEFSTVIIPVLTQHFKMLYRNLIYTGLTRAKTLTVFVGTRRALAMAVTQQDTSQRQTALAGLVARGVQRLSVSGL